MNKDQGMIRIQTVCEDMERIVQVIRKCEDDAGHVVWEDVNPYRVNGSICIDAPLNKAKWILRQIRRTSGVLLSRVYTK